MDKLKQSQHLANLVKVCEYLKEKLYDMKCNGFRVSKPGLYNKTESLLDKVNEELNLEIEFFLKGDIKDFT